MKITVLVENTTNSLLKSEHGLSLLIEFEGRKYLLDAGTTDLFLENAKEMGIEMNDIEICILSHGHYDHSGGFGTYLRENRKAVVYAMNSAEEDYYSGSGEMHFIGIPKEVLEEHRERFCFGNGIRKLDDNVYLVSHITENSQKIGERAKLYVKKKDDYFPDDFSHEMSLVFDTEKGLVIFNSCSHAGVQNIISEVKAAISDKKIHAFVGGLHMKGKMDGKDICTFTEGEVQELCEFLKENHLECLYTGHCTGKPAIKLLQKYVGNMVQELTTGMEIVI